MAPGMVDTVRHMKEKCSRRQAQVMVIGQGHVGFPLALHIAQSGFRVVGLDKDPCRVASIRDALSPLTKLTDANLVDVLQSGRFEVTCDLERIRDADCIIMCLPTQITGDGAPDITCLMEVATAIASRLVPPALIVLESTSPPGTARNTILPVLERSQHCVGRDFFLAVSPERYDPGNALHRIGSTPRLVGGITRFCQEVATCFYSQFCQEVKAVKTPEIAELAKLLENTFRFVNVGLANEMAMLCDRLDIDVWEVIQAAATKPFGFMPHYPGAGVGGACIPIVPSYLAALAREHDLPMRFISAAQEVNDEMPNFVIEKLSRLLARQGKHLDAATVLVIGTTYKANVPDCRESPAFEVLVQLRLRGAEALYHDPLVPELTLRDGAQLTSELLADSLLERIDAAVLVTPHDDVDYDRIAQMCPVVLDTRNALRDLGRGNVIPL